MKSKSEKTITNFRHRVYQAYLDHRQKVRDNAGRRTYPSFNTMANRIISPLDVSSWIEPIFQESSRFWVGSEVVQLRRFAERSIYIGMLD